MAQPIPHQSLDKQIWNKVAIGAISLALPLGGAMINSYVEIKVLSAKVDQIKEDIAIIRDFVNTIDEDVDELKNHHHQE